MLKRDLSLTVASVTITLVVAGSGAPVFAAGVPVLTMEPAMAVASGDAVERLTSVVPVVASCTAPPDAIDVELTGVVTNAGNLPFRARLRILAGPSFKVADEVSNMIEAIEGTFEFGDSKLQRQWTVTGVRDGHLFPKSYFLNGDDLRIMLPMEFKRVAAGQADSPSFPLQGDPDGTIRAIFVLRCEVENQALRCISLKSVFGDVLNERVKSSRNVSDLVPGAMAVPQSSESSSASASPASFIRVGCCVGESKCACVDCEGVHGPPVQCNQINCPTCMPNGCDACIEVGCPPC